MSIFRILVISMLEVREVRITKNQVRHQLFIITTIKHEVALKQITFVDHVSIPQPSPVRVTPDSMPPPIKCHHGGKIKISRCFVAEHFQLSLPWVGIVVLDHIPCGTTTPATCITGGFFHPFCMHQYLIMSLVCPPPPPFTLKIILFTSNNSPSDTTI